jgi:hypothetical protein
VEDKRMIRTLGVWAHWLDRWLKTHVGRPYTIVLVIGLVGSITASIKAITTEFASTGNIAVAAGTIAMDIILLVNQLAQFHEYREFSRERRAARKAAKSPSPPGDAR